jgi:hypothetical protein
MTTKATSLLARGALLLLFVISGCSKDAPAGPGADAAELVRRGWERFSAGDLSGAAALFESATAADATLAEAPLGLGWTRLRQRQLAASSAALDRAASLGEDGANLHAARAIVAREQSPPDWSAVVTAVDRVLAAAPTFEFVYDSTLDWRDLRLLAGQSAFALGNYSRARAEVIALGGPALDPLAPDFTARLLEALDALGAAE